MLLHPQHETPKVRLLYPTQTDAQRAIARLINSHPLYAAGECDLEKWPNFALKAAALYGVDLSPAARQYRKKKKGECSTHLIAAEMAPKEWGTKVKWYFLVSEKGAGPVKEKEKLQDARDKKSRLIWGDYKLLTMTRPREYGGGTRWTWNLRSEIEAQEEKYLTALAQASAKENQPKRLDEFIRNSLLRRPMHSGVRSQIARMLRRARVIWQKHAKVKKDGTKPDWPSIDPDKLPIMTGYRRKETGAAA